MEKKPFKKFDIILFAVLLVILAGTQLFLVRNAKIENADPVVVITVDGEESSRYRLADMSAPWELKIETESGYNIISISSSGVCVKEADCGDETCVHMGTASRPGDMIVCIPHRMAIAIEDGNVAPDLQTDAIDAVIK